MVVFGVAAAAVQLLPKAVGGTAAAAVWIVVD